MGVQGFLVEAFQSNVAPENKEKMSVWVLLLALLVQLLLNALIGQWLWNNSLVKLVPNLKKARWWDTIALAVLLMIVLPQ
tara:strand:+ start:569 stop:808 length:240 start_codon:yes stop_codon:yes gene_type:complete